MAMPIYLSINGAQQNDIKGETSRSGHKDELILTSFEHRIESPVDPATGLHTGRITHHPLKVSKEVDSSSPLLYSAMVNNEQLEVTIKWWRADKSSGNEEH